MRFGAVSTAPQRKRTTHVRNQPAFLNADTPIRLHSDVTATLQLCAVSLFARGVDATVLSFTTLLTTPPPSHPLTPAALGWKALWRAGSPLNSPPKNRARLPRCYRFAQANRNASWMPLSGPLPRGYSRFTARSEFSIYKHCSGKISLPISIRKQVSRGVGAPALLSALSGPWEGIPVKYSQDSTDNWDCRLRSPDRNRGG